MCAVRAPTRLGRYTRREYIVILNSDEKYIAHDNYNRIPGIFHRFNFRGSMSIRKDNEN